jgi:hypothetical protein
MTAKKDPDISENIDLSKEGEQRPSVNPAAKAGEEGGEVTGTDIKNAHAAGDGAYGRNDKNLYEGDDEADREVADEPPY